MAALAGCLLATALQFPSLDKPYHVDDYLFVRVARNTVLFPDAPYIGPDLFTGVERELYVHNNPPLVPAVLAATLATLGVDVVALHLVLLPFTLLAVAAFAALAGKICDRPLVPTLLWAGGIPLVLSGTHLMSDVPALALGLAALAFVLAAQGSGWRALLWAPAGVLLGLAPLAKYSMAFFSVLVPALAWRRGMSRGRLIALVLLGALPSVLWGAQNLLVHGELHVLASGRQGADSPLGLEWMAWWWVRQKAMATLAAVGQVGVPPLLIAALAALSRPRWPLLVSLMAAGWLSTLLPGYSPIEIGQFAAWSGLGCFALLAPLRSRGDGFLKLWLYGLLALTVLILPFASVRFLLPCLSPLLLLTWKALEPLPLSRWIGALCVMTQVACTVAVTEADYRYARLYSSLAAQAARLAQDRGVQLWFAAEGALRPELEEHGARYLRSRVDSLPEGSLVAIGVNCHHYGLSPRLSTVLYEDTVLDRTFSLGLRLESSEARAGFYAHPNGYLPVALSEAVAESLYLFRVGEPNPFARQFLERRGELAVQGEIVENVHQFKRGFWPSFRAHPPSVVRFEVDVPPGARLRFGFGLREEISGPSYGDGVTFRVRGRRTEDATAPALLFERTIDPKHLPEERILHQAEIPLGDLAGGRLVLDFENDCGPASDCTYDWALWTMPELRSSPSH